METIDCVVIGAGWYGLSAAKNYHGIFPDASIAVFDAQSTLGGTWAEERLYPGLKSNNLFGSYEYPDFPMDTEKFGVKKNEHIPGTVIHTYHKAYAKEFGITDFIRLKTKVISAEHQATDNGGWLLTVVSSDGVEKKAFARKLIIATGLTSEAFLPAFSGQETFGGRIFHGKHFRQNSDTLRTAKSVTVFGGSKFAWDAVYMYATANVKVNWVIRSSGHGPCWMAPPHVTPLKRWIEALANTRLLTWFSPCVWGAADGYSRIRNFLHGTMIGRFIVDTFWKILGGDVISLNGYDSHPETAKLKPWIEAMFIGTSFSILNYDTPFFDLIKSDKVKIHTSEIDHLSPQTVHLSDGTELESDALVVSTGWKHVPPVIFLPEGIEKDLGIPHSPDEGSSEHNRLISRADAEILERFPRLKTPPTWNRNYVPLTDLNGVKVSDAVTPYTELTSFMLHRFIVPPSPRFLRNRDIAFLGMVSNFSNVITAHVQSLWVSAYFSGRLVHDPATAIGDEAALHKMQYETVLHNRFGHWRYPTDWGNRYPSFIFDAVPYLDLLLGDLGLELYRKKGFWSNITKPYMPVDYQDLGDEWRRKHGRVESSDRT